MLQTRGKKIVHDVLSRKVRTLLVSAAIFVGVAGTIALFSMSDILVRQLKTDIDEDKLAMAHIEVNTVSGGQLDNTAYLQKLNESDGVTQVVGGIKGQKVYFQTSTAETEFESGWVKSYAVVNQAGELVSVFGEDAPLEPLRLETGTFPAVGANEIAVEQRMADKYGLNVGDTLVLRVLSPSRIPDRNRATGTVEEWTISGIAFDAYTGSAKPDGALFARFEDATYLIGVTGFSDFWLRFNDFPTAENQVDHILNLIATETPYSPSASAVENPAESSLIQGAEMIGSIMSFLAITALIVSGFLVINVISAIVLEQKRQIGVMKALGASRFDNVIIYSGIALSYGVLGVIPGVIVGIPAGNAIAQAIAPEINAVLDGFQVSLLSIVEGILVGLLVPVLASLLPVFNGTRVRILDAMSDWGIDAKYGKGLLARLIKILPLPITIRQGLSNVTLKKTRMLFTILTLGVAAGAFMGIYSGFDQVTRALDLLTENFNVQMAMVPLEARDPAEIESLVESQFSDKITVIEPGCQMEVEMVGYTPEGFAGMSGSIIAYGYDTNSADPAFRFTIETGQVITPETTDNGIIVSSRLASAANKKIGDHVVMQVPGASSEFEIVGIAKFPFDQVWLHWEALARLAGYGSAGTVRPQLYYMNTSNPDAAANEVDDVIADLNDAFVAAGIPASAINYEQMVTDTTQTYTSFQYILQVVAMLVALVGALGLLITLSMSVFERQKEIGVMRSIGASSSTVVVQFVSEGLVVGALAWLIGLPLMLVLESALIALTGFDEVLKLEITPAAVIIGFVGIMAITFVASLIPALTAARKTVSDILRYG
jgi:putative ABC transport system permease protein